MAIIPLLPAPAPCPLLCPINPIYLGMDVTVRNGRRGFITAYYLKEPRVRVELFNVGLWFPYSETYTIDELAKYNPQWRLAPARAELARAA